MTTYHHTVTEEQLELDLDCENYSTVDVDYDISNFSNTITAGGYLSVSGSSITGLASAPYVFSTAGINGSWNTTASTAITKITGDGLELDESADIKIGNLSLKNMLGEIADRLTILIPDAKLETEYEELRQARAEYERVKDKLKMLEALKKTPVTDADN